MVPCTEIYHHSAGAVLALLIVRSLWIPRASAALIPAQASHSKEKNLWIPWILCEIKPVNEQFIRHPPPYEVKGDCFSLMSVGELIKVKTEKFLSTPSVATLTSGPSVAVGTAPLTWAQKYIWYFFIDPVCPSLAEGLGQSLSAHR